MAQAARGGLRLTPSSLRLRHKERREPEAKTLGDRSGKHANIQKPGSAARERNAQGLASDALWLGLKASDAPDLGQIG
jgi:hypothetical protein